MFEKNFQVSSDEGTGKLSKFVEFSTQKHFKIHACVIILAREEQNILTPHMFKYSHANTSLGQSERTRTILVIYKRCYQLSTSL